MLLMIDNYDSFTYTIVSYFQSLGKMVQTVRNDEISISDIKTLNPEGILISPGPGAPQDAGISLQTIEAFAGVIPILGICLGHQCIGKYFGGIVKQASTVMHGKTSEILHRREQLFADITSPMVATRYHSLLVDEENFPSCLRVDAWTQAGEIMAISHKTLPIYGIQFHPESVLTVDGIKIFKNFLVMSCQPVIASEAKQSNSEA